MSTCQTFPTKTKAQAIEGFCDEFPGFCSVSATKVESVPTDVEKSILFDTELENHKKINDCDGGFNSDLSCPSACGTPASTPNQTWSMLSPAVNGGSCPNTGPAPTYSCAATPACPADCQYYDVTSTNKFCQTRERGTYGWPSWYTYEVAVKAKKRIVEVPAVGSGSCPGTDIREETVDSSGCSGTVGYPDQVFGSNYGEEPDWTSQSHREAAVISLGGWDYPPGKDPCEEFYRRCVNYGGFHCTLLGLCTKEHG
jgi:hypothetical protein